MKQSGMARGGGSRLRGGRAKRVATFSSLQAVSVRTVCLSLAALPQRSPGVGVVGRVGVECVASGSEAFSWIRDMLKCMPSTDSPPFLGHRSAGKVSRV